MKLTILASISAMAALAASPVMSSHLYKRHDVALQAQFQRPITPDGSLSCYLREAEKGVKIFKAAYEALVGGEPTAHSMSLAEQGMFVLTSALGDATYALKAGMIKTDEAEQSGEELKKLAKHVKPIAKKVGDLKPTFDMISPTASKQVAVQLQYLAGSFDQFYQALKGQLYANAKQTVAGFVLEIICALDAASTKLDSCSPLTDADFCKKGKVDWESLPHQCPGMDKCSSDDIRKGLYASHESGCYEESCRDADWCKKADKQDLCKWTPSKWIV